MYTSIGFFLTFYCWEICIIRPRIAVSMIPRMPIFEGIQVPECQILKGVKSVCFCWKLPHQISVSNMLTSSDRIYDQDYQSQLQRHLVLIKLHNQFIIILRNYLLYAINNVEIFIISIK